MAPHPNDEDPASGTLRPVPPAEPSSLDLEEETAEEKSPLVLVAQFFLIPLAVVVVAVGIFLLFGLATRERHSPEESLQEVRTGSQSRRWHAAYELSLALARDPQLVKNDTLFTDTLATFEAAKAEPPVRRYLALALGRFERRAAVPALAAALDDEDEETRLYAALALGSIKDPAAAAPLVKLLRNESPTLRKTAAFALGAIQARDAIEPLRVAAEDPHFDVALQGALALAQMGDASGLPTLRKALDRALLAAELTAAAIDQKPVRPEQLADALTSAIRGVVLVHDAESIPRLEALSKSDPDLRVRDQALRALEELRA